MITHAKSKTYFFCGIGGSGMTPLAMILVRQGHRVFGSDRAHDQRRSPEKFKALHDIGIRLFPQDGSGVTAGVDTVVVSSAIEDSVPDIHAALQNNIPVRKRADLLAELFNHAETGIAVAGTSGKSTVTGMAGVMLSGLGLDPTVVNGGTIRNFSAPMRFGARRLFVTETDESDGSIALFNPSIAVLNNIALDHKPLPELQTLFGDFIARAHRAAVLNFDDPGVETLAGRASVPVIGYGITNQNAALLAVDVAEYPAGVDFKVRDSASGELYPVHMNVAGRHNVYNALASLSVARAMGLPLAPAIAALEKFQGIARRFEKAGEKNGITVIDDFGHNPDKIAATLKTVKKFPGRVFVIFQPHGYAPLKMMGAEIVAVFSALLGADDMLLMPEVFYAGGTAEKSVTAKDIVESVDAKGVTARWFAQRTEILPFLKEKLQPGDRVIVMGARDDTLSDFARGIVEIL
jgi:UDP-N-acetylmuramate--alanine ligase